MILLLHMAVFKQNQATFRYEVKSASLEVNILRQN